MSQSCIFAGRRPAVTLVPALLCAASVAVMMAAASNAQAADAADAPTHKDVGASRASAETVLGEVIVTARRREENLQNVPATVTAINPTMLKQQNVTVAADLMHIAPSLTVVSAYTSLYTSYAVRGLSTGVTTYFADAPCCASSSNIPFLDVANIQVLAGPQGTLFGRSSAAGAVLIEPQRPKLDEYGGMIDGVGGTYGRAQFTGVANIPIIPGHLAIRLDANSNHVDGYTSLIGSPEKLDELNNQQYRIGVEFKAGRFENYLVGQFFNTDESATSEVLGGSNLNYPLYNLPASQGQANFGAACAQAVSSGLAQNLDGCISQRLGILNKIQQTLASETARLAGGGKAVRTTLPSYDGIAEYNKERRKGVVDNAQFDVGDLGLAKITVKNVFAYEAYTSMVSGPNDGLGGIADEASFTETNSDGGSNQVGNRMTSELPPYQTTLSDEVQIHGDTGDGLLIWTLGGFYSHTKVPQNLNGTGVVYEYFGGVYTPNLGNTSADGFMEGGFFNEVAGYGQATLDLSRFGVHGLSFTAGYRYSHDTSEIRTFPEVYNYPSGTITPSSSLLTTDTDSNGYNYTFSLSEKINPDLMVYGTISRAYVPGGINGFQASTTTLPNFTPTYAPETVLNKEIGIKSDFSLGDVRARVNADVYLDDFTNITERFVADVGGTTGYYYENAAAARLKGFEIQATIIPTSDWEISLGYNYNDAHYKKWISSDPFNMANPGDAACLASSPSGSCYLDLKDNPFAYMPKQQGHVSVLYHVPMSSDLGEASLSATVYAQSRVYFESDAARDLQLLPSDKKAISQAAYATMNLRAQWNNVKQSDWNVALFVNNLTNAIYTNGEIESPITSGFSVKNYAAPRMFGFEVSRQFGGG